MELDAVGDFEETENVLDSSWQFSPLSWISKTLIDAGLFISEPFYWASEEVEHAFTPIRPGTYGNCDHKMIEVARRIVSCVFQAACSPLSIGGFLIGGGLQMVGDAISDKPYHYRKGCQEEPAKDTWTLFDLNVCAYWGYLPKVFGGVDAARNRLEKLADLIVEKGGDICLLQEVSSSSGIRLAHLLKDHYAHFFTHIGCSAGTWVTSGTVGSELFVASKVPFKSVQFIPYENAVAARKKLGFFCIETESAYVLTAHFPDGTKEETWEMHKELVLQANNFALTKTKPCLLAGDLNIRRDKGENDEYAYTGLGNYFQDPRGDVVLSEETATCTNQLIPLRQGSSTEIPIPFEIDDYILLHKKDSQNLTMDIELGSTYDLAHPDQALTDHRYLKATISRTHPS